MLNDVSLREQELPISHPIDDLTKVWLRSHRRSRRVYFIVRGAISLEQQVDGSYAVAVRETTISIAV